MDSNTFTCKYCDKTFARKFTLDNHIESHHQKKGYLCEICKVRICRKRPHSCAVQIGVCECLVCGLQFLSSKAMFRHRNSAHPVDMTALNSGEMETESNYDLPKKPSTRIILPSIDTLLQKTLFLGEQEAQETNFQNHPALRHFQLSESTVVCCEDVLLLKCPLCFDAYNTFDSFKEHIECYTFLPLKQKTEFLDAVSEIIADMTTIYCNPTNNIYVT